MLNDNNGGTSTLHIHTSIKKLKVKIERLYKSMNQKQYSSYTISGKLMICETR